MFARNLTEQKENDEMKKEERISVNAFEKAIESVYEPTVTVQYNGLDVIIKKHIELEDMAGFVDVCVKSCFDEDNAGYTPESKDFVIRACIINYYTNITLPMSIKKQYSMVYGTDIINVVKEHINKEQLAAIIDAINEKIRNITESNVGLINKQLEEVHNAFDQVQDKFAKMFEGISTEDVKKVMYAITDGGLDEEKLVKAYMENKQDGEAENG